MFSLCARRRIGGTLFLRTECKKNAHNLDGEAVSLVAIEAGELLTCNLLFIDLFIYCCLLGVVHVI